MPQIAFNPFIYPGPVPVERFVDREAALHTLLSRIATGLRRAFLPSVSEHATIGAGGLFERSAHYAL